MNSFTCSLFALLLVTGIQAQTTTPKAQTGSTQSNNGTVTTANPPVSNCYTRWEDIFEERGANEVTDGVYDNIIISVRNGPAAHCYTGKVEVKDGKITAMYRQLDDGSYETFNPKLKYNVPMTIVNGISVTLLTMDDELVNVIFPATLKPKKAGYAAAPDPPQD